MTYTLRRAVRERSYLLLALAGPTGSGKTYSALRLASGLAGDQRFAVIDTEARRATHYVPPFDFEHLDLEAPFTPDNYVGAIKACLDAHVPVIVIDSMSHEWAGTGGVSEWHEDLLDQQVERVLKRDAHAEEWKVREALNIGAWREPKMAHKRLMQGLLQVRAHIIFCLRAEEKLRFVPKNPERPSEGNNIVTGWAPICEKNFMFEMTASFLLSPDQPGVPKPIKLQQQHEAYFPLDRPITQDAGRRLAAWAAGSASAGGSHGTASSFTLPEPARSTDAPVEPAPATQLAGMPGPDPPSYKAEEAMGMVARMAGGRASAKDIEAAFAPGVRNLTHVMLFQKKDPDQYKQRYDAIYRQFLAWKDEHA